MITDITRLAAIGGSLALLVLIVELVRRRRLKEEYSVLWVLTALVLLLLSAWFDLLVWITDAIGGVAPSSTLFFFGLMFVFFMLLHFSVRVSALERKHTALVQEIGLMARKTGDAGAALEPVADPRDTPRVAVVIPCHNDGELLEEALASVREEEPVELVVVDNGSTDEDTRRRLASIEGQGIRVLREQDTGGPGPGRTAGMRATTAPFVFPLDADDKLVPGALAEMADTLERHPNAGFAWGDYLLFGAGNGKYRSPDRWLPWTLTWVNPYPISSLYRRETLMRADGWRRSSYEDWDLWVRLVGLGIQGVRVDGVVYERRLHRDTRRAAEGRARHRKLYEELEQGHPEVFEARAALRREERPAFWKRLAYPIVFGPRKYIPVSVEAFLQRTMMRMGTGLPGR